MNPESAARGYKQSVMRGSILYFHEKENSRKIITKDCNVDALSTAHRAQTISRIKIDNRHLFRME